MKQLLFYVFILFASCSCQESTRCSIYDSECQKRYYQTLGRENAKKGFPELGIPVIDPFAVPELTYSLLGLLNLTLLEGTAEGISRCILTKFESNVEARYRRVELICDKIIIRGRYKLTPSPILGKMCGWCNVHGAGNGTIIIENWSFKFKYPFRIIRRENGEIYLKALFDQAEYEADEEKVTVAADCITQGNHVITKSIVHFINKNWELIMNSDVGKFINDKSAEYYYDIYNLINDRIPANQSLNDDLYKLVDN